MIYGFSSEWLVVGIIYCFRVELRDVITKQEDIQSLLQAKQDKLGVAEQKLLSYNQRLSNIKTTLGNWVLRGLCHVYNDGAGRVLKIQLQ